MSEREAFIRSIVAEPEDSLRRLVFADWLDEHGEGDWAAMIRQPRPPEDCYGYGSNSRELRPWRRLMSSLADAIPKRTCIWLRPPSSSWASDWGGMATGGDLLTVAIRHGFVDAVAWTMKRLTKYLPAIVAVQPVTQVGVMNVHFEPEIYRRFMPIEETDSKRRCISERDDRVPVGVLARLTVTPVEARRDRLFCYRNLDCLHNDLGRAFLKWARGQAK